MPHECRHGSRWRRPTTPTGTGHWGRYGGRFVPEALVAALDELTEAVRRARLDPVFAAELSGLHRSYTGRPSPLTDARRVSEHAGGARVLLKREDLNHTGSHKINNVLGQALLTQRMGKSRVIAETGAGQHGVATATACALLGLECVVYMGEEDTRRQALNVARMKLLGAEVVSVTNGSRTLKDAINEAMRDWVTNVESTHYLLGTVTGPHPVPDDGSRVSYASSETRPGSRRLTSSASLPDAVCACVGGGSNAIGIFNAFLARRVGCPATVLKQAAKALTPAVMPRASAAGHLASCTALGRTFCRTQWARRSPATRSQLASTTQVSDPFMRGSTSLDAPRTDRSPTPRPWTHSRC